MKTVTKYLLGIMLVALLLRLAFISQADGPTFRAYETIEQARHIAQTGAPLVFDTPHGKYFPLPIFPYLLAFANLFLSDTLTYLFIPNLLAVTAHAAIFYLVLELTGKENFALLAALASVFVPVYLTATLLTVSSLSLAIPLILVCVTLYLKLRKSKESRNLLLTLFIILSFTDQIALLFIPFLVLSLILATVREAKGEAAQQEFAVFAVFYLVWLFVILYKNFLAAQGFKIFAANTPQTVLVETAQTLSAQMIATQIGVLVFGFALYATYKETAGEHIGIQGVIALAFAVAISLLLQLVPLTAGLALFSLVSVALAAVGLLHYRQYSKSLRRSAWHDVAAVAVGILFIATSVLPTATEGLRAPEDAAPIALHNAAQWIEQNTPKESLLLAPSEWGFLLETESERPVYLTENYLRYSDSDKKYEILDSVLRQSTDALKQVPTAEYIVSRTPPRMACVNIVYSKEIFIAKVLCS